MDEVRRTTLDISTLIAYFLFALADFVMYFGLFWVLRSYCKSHRLGVVAFVVLIGPFIYPLVYAGSLFNLLWMLFFTPFYGLIIMILVYPAWMLLYYAVSFGSLCVIAFLSRKYKKNLNKHRPNAVKTEKET